METLTKVLIGVGVGAAALIGFGVYEASASAAPQQNPSSLPLIGEGVPLVPGAMSLVQLSTQDAAPQLTLVAPAAPTDLVHGGGSITSTSTSGSSPVLTGSMGSWTASQAGTTTLTIQWQDAYGNAYTSTLPVIVVTTATNPPAGNPTITNTTTAAPVSAKGPYAAATSLTAGKTYLISAPPPAGAVNLLASLQAYGAVNQTWPANQNQVPANWPAGDTDPSKMRASFTYSGIVAIPVSAIAAVLPGATVYSTGQ